MTEKFCFKISKGDTYKIFPIMEDKDEFILITELASKSTLNIYRINVDDSKYTSNIQPTQSIFIPNLYNKHRFFTDESCVTCKNKFLVFSFEGCLIYVDISKNKILVNYYLNVQNNLKYFINPTNIVSNRLKYVTSLEKTDDMLALNNLNNLICVSFDSVTNQIKLLLNEKLNFESFKINGNILIAFDKLNNCVTAYSLDKRFFLQKYLVFISLKDDVLETYGLSQDSKYIYVIVNSCILNFYRVENNELIANVKLYSPVLDIFCTNEYVAMSMLDKKIISLIIVDPKIKNSSQKLANLKSRFE